MSSESSENVCSSDRKKGVSNSQLKPIKLLDPHFVSLLTSDHCLFCLQRKSQTNLRINKSPDETFDGYELIYSYFGMFVADNLNDIYDAMLLEKRSLNNAEFPAPLLCLDCVKVIQDLRKLHLKLEKIQLRILREVKVLQDKVLDSSVIVNESDDDGSKQIYKISQNRLRFENEIFKNCMENEETQEAVINILDGFQQIFNDEAEKMLQVPLKLLNDVRSFPSFRIPCDDDDSDDDGVDRNQESSTVKPHQDASTMTEVSINFNAELRDAPLGETMVVDNQDTDDPSPISESAEVRPLEIGFEKAATTVINVPLSLINGEVDCGSGSSDLIEVTFLDSLTDPFVTTTSENIVTTSTTTITSSIESMPKAAATPFDSANLSATNEPLLFRTNGSNGSIIHIIKNKETEKVKTQSGDQQKLMEPIEIIELSEDESCTISNSSENEGSESETDENSNGEEQSESETDTESTNASSENDVDERDRSKPKRKWAPSSAKMIPITKPKLRKNGQPKPFICEYCDYDCCRIGLFRKHYAKVHDKILKPKVNLRQYTCDICGFSNHQLRLAGFVQHLESHEKNTKVFHCEDCLGNFTTLQLYQMHICPQTGEVPGTATVDLVPKYVRRGRPYTCRICKHVEIGEKAILSHFNKSHPDEKPFQCKICLVATFSDLNLLKNHVIMTHNGVKWKCRICLKGTAEFTKYIAYFKHLNTNHFDNHYKCEHCGKRFVDKLHWKNHLTTHTKQMDYTCEICGKNMTSSTTLRSHRRLHDPNVMKHICEFCSKGFLDLSNLKKHIATVHGDGKAVRQRSPKNIKAKRKSHK